MAKCRSCDAKVTWTITERGKTMPIDPEPRADGNLIKTGRSVEGKPEVHYITDRDELEGTEARFVSHFATCNDPKRFRR